MIVQNLPEEVFEGTLYWLLQGERKDRQIIDLNVKQFSLLTPHQLQILGWPKEYIVGKTRKGINKVYSTLKSKKFRKLFHSSGDDLWHFRPCHRYIKLWGEEGEEKVRAILYFNSLEEKEKTKNLINNHLGFKINYNDKTLEYKLIARDYSHMCCCSICSKFMPSHAERLQINKRNAQIFEDHYHFWPWSISDKNDWNHVLCQVPICVECLYSKERQGQYRMNMYNHDHFKYGYYVNSPEERQRDNKERSLEVEKPDMTDIPQYDNFKWETPLDYCGSLKCILNPYSTFYWHPSITADEYMRYQEYHGNKILEDVDPLDDDFYPEDDDVYPEDY